MDSQRLLLVIALAFVGLLMWQAWMEDYGPMGQSTPVTAESKGPQEPADIPDAPAMSAEAPEPGAGDVPVAEEKAESREMVRVRTDVLDVVIDPRGGVLTQADLLEYPVSVDQPDNPFRLLEKRPGRVFVAQSGLRAVQGEAPDHHAEYTPEAREYSLQPGEDRVRVKLTWEGDDGVEVTKTLTFYRGSYRVDVEHQVTNAAGDPWKGSQYRQLQRTEEGRESAFLYTYTGGVYAGDEINSDDRVTYEKIDFGEMADDPLSRDLNGGWAAMIQHYFVGAWVPVQDQQNHFYTLVSEQGARPLYSLGMISPARTVAPGDSAEFTSQLYVGPKIQENLEQIAEGLELTVDYGIFTIISKPIFWVLKQFHNWVGNWGWAIILVTLLIKILFYKLSETSYRSMARMRKLQPKLQQLKERFGEDRQRMSQEMMKLYQKEKINPLGGCLPILVQIPVFIALYWVLLESVELRQAPWILWINDLSQKDPYFVLPILMGASMWLQQKLNPAPVDPVQQKIFQFLPIVFTVFFAFFPAGLVLYWLVNNVLSIAQQYYITRKIEAQAG